MDNTGKPQGNQVQFVAPTYTIDATAADAKSGTKASVPPTVPASGFSFKSPRRISLDETAEKTPMGILALLAFIFGATFSEMILRGGFGLGVTVVTVLFLAFFVPFFIKNARRASIPGVILTALPLLIIAVSFAFNASFEGRFWMVIAVLLLGAVSMTSASGCTSRSPLSARGMGDSLRTFGLSPIENIGGTFSALSSADKRGKKGIGSVGKILIGLLISIPVVFVLVALFSTADAAFSHLTDQVVEFIDDLNISIGAIILDIIVGAILCVYVIPLVLTLRSGYSEEHESREPRRWLDPVIGSTVVIASTLVYLAFVAVQFNYFFAVNAGYFSNYSFSDVPYLPEGMTWAEYARSGFFELSGIIVATFAVVALIIAFCKRRANGTIPAVMRVALTVLSLCNIVLVVSAVMRMRLYTIWCGLTAKRVGVLLVIAVIALSIIGAVIKIWWEKFDLVRCVALLSVVAITAFSCMNIDALCANTNVARHIEQGTTIDVQYLGSLSYAAAPAVERLMNESPDPDISAAAKGIIARNYYFGDGESCDNTPMTWIRWGAWTYDHEQAYRIFKKYDPEKRCADDYGIYVQWQSDKRFYERYEYDGEPYQYQTLDDYRKDHTGYHYSEWDFESWS